jgi:hypothetical protein
MMKEYSIGHGDLMDFPFEKYLEFSRIITEEKKEEKKEQERQEKEMDQKV